MLKFETCVNPSQMIWENREQSPTRRLVMGILFFAGLLIYIGLSYKALDELKLNYTDRTQFEYYFKPMCP
jgi:hypothetical protein